MALQVALQDHFSTLTWDLAFLVLLGKLETFHRACDGSLFAFIFL